MDAGQLPGDRLDALGLDAVEIAQEAAVKTPSGQQQRDHDHHGRGGEQREKELVPDQQAHRANIAVLLPARSWRRSNPQCLHKSPRCPNRIVTIDAPRPAPASQKPGPKRLRSGSFRRRVRTRPVTGDVAFAYWRARLFSWLRQRLKARLMRVVLRMRWIMGQVARSPSVTKLATCSGVGSAKVCRMLPVWY